MAKTCVQAMMISVVVWAATVAAVDLAEQPLCRETDAADAVDVVLLQTRGDRLESPLTASNCPTVKIQHADKDGKIMQVKGLNSVEKLNTQLQCQRDAPNERWVFSIVNWGDENCSRLATTGTKVGLLNQVTGMYVQWHRDNYFSGGSVNADSPDMRSDTSVFVMTCHESCVSCADCGAVWFSPPQREGERLEFLTCDAVQVSVEQGLADKGKNQWKVSRVGR